MRGPRPPASRPAPSASGAASRVTGLSLHRWAGLCAAAEALGMAAAATAAKTSQSLVGEPWTGGDAALVLGLVTTGGLVEGAALGLLQAAGLRRMLPRLDARRWVLVTVVVAGLGWAAASAPSAFTAPTESASPPPLLLILGGALLLGAAMGAVLGTVQALVLRAAVRFPWRWTSANALGWALAMVVVFLGATTSPADWSVPAVIVVGAATGAVAGTVLGTVTGWFLPSLSGPSPHNRTVLALLRSPIHRLFDRSLVAMRIRGAVSGLTFELPVMYAEDQAGLVVVPGRHEIKRWWRNLRRPAHVDLLHRGHWQLARGVALTPDDAAYETAVATYRHRWPRTTVPPSCPVVRLTLPPAPLPRHGHDRE